jgi:hypothetical protein
MYTILTSVAGVPAAAVIFPCAMVHAACAHCEQRPAGAGLGLCSVCHAVKGIRKLYVRHRGWTPAWEAHLRRLRERAQKQLPLFSDETSRD